MDNKKGEQEEKKKKNRFVIEKGNENKKLF